MSEIIIDKNAKQITFTNNGIAFSQFGIANEILDLIENQEKEIEKLNNIINEINSIVEYWGYDKEHNDISSFRMAMKNIKDVLGSDK